MPKPQQPDQIEDEELEPVENDEPPVEPVPEPVPENEGDDGEQE